ncbi:pantoate--beta-alanine ligase [Leptospira ilyithenensis]|uniref:Pantothenate synthetase n=1 Tax=Leptospira ilyithenensis TaxID=2484901 RepID=A0A4R9LQC8_9LEPT|nr:pantoate--beta-alanine ligase [Leptospira ilyithenensis]TGN08401.1 pantoate--beta-alanine ligase [Leptospira ilyithenensis]
MIVCKTKEELKTRISLWKKEGKTIGFAPTMGYLHSGHISLIEQSKAKADKTIVSLFVNPTQFNDPEDYLKYPLDMEGDLKKCKEAGVDLVFIPTKEVVYPDGTPDLIMKQPALQKNLCGRTRPNHFEGVMLVVSKLFHLLNPDFAFFGLKDYQQFRIIEEMVHILDFPIQVIGVPTLRERDGLAMSSRNVRLTEKERENASLIPRMFTLAGKLLVGGEKNPKVFHEILADFLLSSPEVKIDYIESVDPHTLQEKLTLDGELVLAIAVFLGKTRLIDNQRFSKI